MILENYEHFLGIVKSRRTVRHFKPDPIPDGYVEKIIEAARWAPSGFNTQPWEFIVIRNPDIKRAVIEVLDGKAPPITNPEHAPRRTFRDAPVFILLLADWRAMTGLPGHPTEKNDMVASIYCSGLASAFLCLHLAAASLGISTQWYSAVSRPQVETELRKIIGFPESMTIYDMMVLGYPETPPAPKEIRSLERMVHYDACGTGDFRTDEQVQAYAEKTWEWCMQEH